METATANRIAMLIRKPKPVDLLFVEMVCEYLERVECPPTAQSEAGHVRLLTPTKRLISDAKAAVISATAARWHCDESALTAWQLDSVILWARELAEAEVLRVPASHVDADYARAVRACGHVARPVSRSVVEVAPSLNEHCTDPSRIRAS